MPIDQPDDGSQMRDLLRVHPSDTDMVTESVDMYETEDGATVKRTVVDSHRQEINIGEPPEKYTALEMVDSDVPVAMATTLTRQTNTTEVVTITTERTMTSRQVEIEEEGEEKEIELKPPEKSELRDIISGFILGGADQEDPIEQ
ncbi:unnamed protein product, partial [Owenia fusiformis]